MKKILVFSMFLFLVLGLSSVSVFAQSPSIVGKVVATKSTVGGSQSVNVKWAVAALPAGLTITGFTVEGTFQFSNQQAPGNITLNVPGTANTATFGVNNAINYTIKVTPQVSAAPGVGSGNL